jgi:nitroimidazol reductase NimA-like FMN-containing flavoprotein (pyridoxamine 5'-phosphate oxidase superfamily)
MSYTQAPHLTKEEIESLLKEVKIARFCSLNDDGSIHAVPVWFKYENGQIIMGTLDASRKARNVKHNSRVTVLVDVEAWPQKAVLIYGEAKLDYKDVFSKLVSVCEKYMPKEEAKSWVEGLLRLSKWVIMIIKPERMASFDYTKDKAFQTVAQG